MKKNITAAILGSGFMGKKYLDILTKHIENVILCSTDIEGGKQLAAEYKLSFYEDYNELFDNERLDFVCICLPTHLHYPATMAAINHNINVLCEKPFASNPEQAAEMIRAAEDHNITLMVGHCRRFSKYYEYLKRCIQNETFGKLMYLNLFSHSERPLWSTDNWLANMSLSGGVVMDFHIHDTDMMINFFSTTPESVYTTGNDYAINTTYKFADGLSVTASASWRNPAGYPFASGYDAVFEKGSLKAVLTDFDESLILYEDNSTRNPIDDESFSEHFKSNNVYENEIIYFVNCLLNNQFPDLCDPKDSLKSIYTNYSELNSLKNDSITKVDVSY